MPNVVVLDLETVATDAAADAVLSAPFNPAAFVPKNGATKPETIARQLEDAEKEWEVGKLARVDQLALSPRTGRIVCVGMHTTGVCEPMLAPTEAGEQGLLECAWQLLADAAPLATYNGLVFDVPFLVIRSALLGVKPSRDAAPLLRRYSTAPHFDVRAVLGNWDKFADGKQSDWAAAFGLPTQLTSGANVGALHRAGDHVAIAAHCTADVLEVWAIYHRLAPFFA